jgi:lipid-A-disaccharide synthase
MVAGETSGDLLGGLLLDGITARWPNVQTFGIGGPQMAKRGFAAWWPHEKLAVRGYVEVLRHYREIVGIRRQLLAKLLADPPDVFIGIDAPDFNLDLERALKAAGVKTVHFISPSIWAWRGGRIDKIRAAVDHMLCVFPFEPTLYAKAGIPATFVGHPLARMVAQPPDAQALAQRTADARKALGFTNSDTVVAVLPGSRASEVKYLANRFFKVFQPNVSAIWSKYAIKIVVPMIPALTQAIQQAARDAGVFERITWLQGQSHTALAACDVALVASGTATLEAALFQKPMVIAYNMHWLSWQIMRRQKYQAWVGLPNILCGEFVVPELLQNAATPAAMGQALANLLDSPETIRGIQARFAALHAQLSQDTAQLATDAIDSAIHP